MHKLRRFYYQNKEMIWKSVGIIVFILLIIQVINIFAKNSNEKKQITNNTSVSSNNDDTNTYIDSNKSAITGEKVNEQILDTANKSIEKFVNACNNKEYEIAYGYLSADCKEQVYNSLEKFKQRYVDKIFTDKKVAKIENWSGNIYKVNYTEDIMATGNINSETIRDYITIVLEDGEQKLNISSFVSSENVDKEKTENNITTKVLQKNVFMEYEEYVIEIQNKTNNTILMDTTQNSKTVYLQDEKDVKYYWNNYEIPAGLLKINSQFSTNITIKFPKEYNSNIVRSTSIVFSNVVMNYRENVNENQEKTEIRIKL